MREGNIFVCVSVPVQAIIFGSVYIETSFWYDGTSISRSSLSIKVTGSRPMSYDGKCLHGYLDISLTWCHMSKVRVMN